jgi:CheY-like chemotaxis protein
MAGGRPEIGNHQVTEVVLRNLGMPRMDEFEVARRFRNDGGQGVLLVGLTG